MNEPMKYNPSAILALSKLAHYLYYGLIFHLCYFTAGWVLIHGDWLIVWKGSDNTQGRKTNIS